MEYLGAGGPVVNSPNVDKGITTLAINLNLNLYKFLTWKTLKIEHYKHYKHFTPFQNNIKNIAIRTINWQSAMRQRKKKSTDNFSCVKERKNT